jgi:hypothetical protein
MIASTEYSAREQTAAQRQELINKGRAWNVAQGATPGPEAEAVYARYVAGELTLQGVTNELVNLYRSRSLAAATTTTAKAIAALDNAFSGQQAQQHQMQPEQLELV